ncbi:MAG: type II secretion system F family protein [Lentisphaeria bacterium]|nr:type II secretion system F family protein [Lentisphaeria bacterium]
MPVYNYTAMDAQGKEKKGRIEAENETEAGQKLRDDNLHPTSIVPAKAGKKKKKNKGPGIVIGTPKLKTKQVTQFTRQLATLLDAGLPLVRALRTLERQAKDPIQRMIIGNCGDSVEGGLTFSEALNEHKKSFDHLYVNMVRAGEASGAMEQVLAKLADYMEKAQKLRAKVKSALVYPVVVLSIAMIITAGLLYFIVPKFAKMFDELLAGEELPALTQFVVGASEFVQNQFLLVVGMGIVGFIALKVFRKTNFGRYFSDYMMLKLPPFGNLVTKSSVARFCSTLSTLMASGVSVLQALQIVRDTSGNEVIARAVQTVHDAVKEGETMAKPLEETNVFPLMVVSMIEVGEETGALPDMLGRVSVIYEEEVDMAVESLTSLIEPIMIVFLGIVIGGIVLAMFMPLIKLIEQL